MFRFTKHYSQVQEGFSKIEKIGHFKIEHDWKSSFLDLFIYNNPLFLNIITEFELVLENIHIMLALKDWNMWSMLKSI